MQSNKLIELYKKYKPRKVGVYKEDDIYCVHYLEDGIVVSIVFNPIIDGSIEEWDKLPNGHRFR